ncbi:Zinc/iron permease [Coniochaeta ligniaria NRRL 30616]|uniref:Zinc/iron permease n=1 Tax=Coniochaeta ligniaria NRRL 30616 TaxID=1408157 RepID=A0A1J7I8W9_9PEZI|nr:Zinc/iron permease [Coniochaeta ligniaria NRRL 30616]
MEDSQFGDIVSSSFSWSNVPTEALLFELSKRDDGQSRPECGSEQRGSYDTAIHVFALFLILVLSCLVFLCQHFGTGVLLATAFVHLLPTAFVSLTDPCLPYVFSKGYKPLAGLIAMVSALVVVAMESYLTTRGAGHSHSHHHIFDDSDEDAALQLDPHGDSFGARRASSHRPTDIALEDMETQGLVAGASPLPGSTPTVKPQNGKLSYKRIGDGEPDEDEETRESLDRELDLHELNTGHSSYQQQESGHSAGQSSLPDTHGPGSHMPPSAEEQKRPLLQCLLLEAGILFHSVFIGMALSVATGPTFAVFLIAIAFHQSFEGLALGSRIAAINFPRSSPRPWLMVLAYGTTTPIGQAIGLFVHRLYDPMSQTGLLMVGVMNAISSGLLLFAGLVQLLAEDFLTEKSYGTLHGKKRVNAFFAVVAGALLMAAIGAIA